MNATSKPTDFLVGSVLYCSVKCARESRRPVTGVITPDNCPDDFNQLYGALCPVCEKEYNNF
ncbi:MAG: hypothetical protein Q8R28_23860 [Dehalococcoidia bacterium]|nr:hypothetical protein [Dehalococcoidia bacterium]